MNHYGKHDSPPLSTARRNRRLTDVAVGKETVPGSGILIHADATCQDEEYEDGYSNMSCYNSVLEQTRSSVVGSYKLSYSCFTAPGTDPGGNAKDNQDSWVIKENIGGKEGLLFGVFDGHGSQGKLVSQHVAHTLPRLVVQSPAFKTGCYESALSTAFPESNSLLRRISGIDCDLSGSTGVVALALDNKLVVGNLGDSRCLLGKVDPAGRPQAVPLSSDHNPLDPREAQRILGTGGRIASFMYDGKPLGPPRVWLREINVPGLCMTRSFGDNVAATVGVLDIPEVLTVSLKPQDKYLVLMSDGIFEFMENQKVIDMVHSAAESGISPHEVAKKLVRDARRLWQEEEDDIIDDCTCVVVYISHQVPSTSATLASISPKFSSVLRIGGRGPSATASSQLAEGDRAHGAGGAQTTRKHTGS